MKAVLSGIVSSCVVHRFENFPETSPGLLIRPMKEWSAAMVVGTLATLILPNGKESQAKIRGFELRASISQKIPRALLIEQIPELNNDVPIGTKVFVKDKE